MADYDIEGDDSRRARLADAANEHADLIRRRVAEVPESARPGIERNIELAQLAAEIWRRGESSDALALPRIRGHLAAAGRGLGRFVCPPACPPALEPMLNDPRPEPGPYDERDFIDVNGGAILVRPKRSA